MAEAPQPVLQLSTRRSGSNTRSWVTRAMIVQIAILAAILSVHYRYVLYRLITIWHTDGDWSHGFLIPLFSLYYLYMQRNRAPVDVPRRGVVAQFMGAGLLTLGFAVYVSCTLLRIDYPKSISLIISILGMILLVCGWPWTRWSWFAVIFLLFALPVPGRLYVQLTMPLRFIAAKVSAAALSTCVPGMDAEAHGALVEYFYNARNGTLDIERACSGIRLLMTMMALGVAMAFVSDRPLWHRQLMILACIPIAIICNIIRVTTTGFMVVLGRDDLARGFWHTMLGLGMLFIAFALFGLISYVLNHLFVEHEHDETR